MSDRPDYPLMKEILMCSKCRNRPELERFFLTDCPPVCCFGDPLNKEVFVVGINPSKAEYDSAYLEKNRERALESQLTYFGRKPYMFFNELERFFDDREVKDRLGLSKSLWNKIGYLDLVKCVTESGKSKQWNGLNTSAKRRIVENCRVFLEKQSQIYKPKLVIAYGKDVGVWFGVQDSDEEEFNLVKHPRNLGFDYQVIYVPQRQGKHSRPEINEIRMRIREALSMTAHR
jgi:uracil-DNA glycosylase